MHKRRWNQFKLIVRRYCNVRVAVLGKKLNFHHKKSHTSTSSESRICFSSFPQPNIAACSFVHVRRLNRGSIDHVEVFWGRGFPPKIVWGRQCLGITNTVLCSGTSSALQNVRGWVIRIFFTHCTWKVPLKVIELINYFILRERVPLKDNFQSKGLPTMK